MRPTRELWAVSLLVVVLAVAAVVFARPLLLVGAAVLGGWILHRQYAFARALSATLDSLSVVQDPGSHAARTDEQVPATLSVTSETPVSTTISVEAGVPTGARLDSPLSVTLGPDPSLPGRSATTTQPVTWPIAGRHRFEPATVTATDGHFRQRVSRGAAPTVTIEPRGPRTVHVGAGGEQVVPVRGDHRGGLLGNALESAEIREYQPGDELKQIDWNTTARLATPHVHEFEGERDRPTLLAIDRRRSLETGPPAETKLDYLREAALGITASAREFGDPLGIVAVDDDGVRDRLAPASTATDYERVRRRLFDLGTADPDTGSAGIGAEPSVTASQLTHPRRRLGGFGDSDQFLETLRPFYERGRDAGEYEPESFVGGLSTALRRHDRRLLVVLCTDDAAPRTVWEAVRAAREQNHQVLLLLTPTVLFEPDGLAEPEGTYERYVAFEEFRRDLDRTSGVRALEVAPAARLETVVDAGERHRAEGQI